MLRAYPKILTVRWDYCHEHYARHLVDDRGQCWGRSLKALEMLGYSWARHIGNGWFKLSHRQPKTLPLDWQLAIEAAEAQAVQHEAKDLEPIDF